MNAKTGSRPGLQNRVPAPASSPEDQSKASPVWIDVDDERPRRRRKFRQPSSEASKSDRPAEQRHQTHAQSEIGRFLPRLSRILEASDPNVRQRSYNSSVQRRDSDDKNRSSQHRDGNDYAHRHSTRRRTSVAPRRPDPLLKFNPSLLSVLSSLTGTSERSSGSNSTITQQSYDRKRGLAPKRPAARRDKPKSSAQSGPAATMSRTKSPNVFDYIEDVSTVDDHDDMSVISPVSSASSHYQPSDAGSSEAPTTPSSRSTMPSPTTARSVSVAELRRKYDPDYTARAASYGSQQGLDHAARDEIRGKRSLKDAEERSDGKGAASSPSLTSSAPDFDDNHRQSSQSSLRVLDDEQRLRQQEDEMRRHVAYSQHHYGYEYTAPPEPSPRQSSPQVNHTSPSNNQSLEHYIHQPMPTRPSPPKLVRATPSPPIDGSPSLTAPPYAPEPPDLTKITLTGYELLASHLSSSSIPPSKEITSDPSHLTPVYRKFSHLHHRVLLHLQDELAEMEHHLRMLDEGIAQTYTVPPAPPTDSSDPTAAPAHYPSSRRIERDISSNHPVFARRTLLLGEIYNKQQQYHTALRDYTKLLRDSRPAKKDEIAAYKSFLADRKPICDGEAAFLDRRGDLIVPGGTVRADHSAPVNTTGRDALWEQASFLAALLLLPLLLSTVLPDFASRAAATALLGAGAGLVVWGARVRGRVGVA
ncbi:hypothetical protein Q7P35_008526 [Cladosporium inversicolor]